MSSQIVFLNGEYVPVQDAKISVLDRGFIFGDGIYEVIPVFKGVIFRFDEHFERLENNLAAVRIKNPNTREQWKTLLDKLISKQPEQNLSIYLQITRGIAPRDHFFPDSVEPSVFIMCNPIKQTDSTVFEQGVAAITHEDNRWQNCHIKTTALLANILLRQEAQDANAYEAILVRDGIVTEGAASNVFIVKDNIIYTTPKSNKVLPGITRDLIVELAQQHNIDCREQEFSEQDLINADEIWITSSTREVLPVLKLNGQPVGDGKPGTQCRKIYEIYMQYKRSLTD